MFCVVVKFFLSLCCSACVWCEYVMMRGMMCVFVPCVLLVRVAGGEEGLIVEDSDVCWERGDPLRRGDGT